MGLPFAICSGSFGGIRLDREAKGYYTLLLEQLGTVIDDPIHVYTDRVGVFSDRLDVIPARLGDYAGDFWRPDSAAKLQKALKRTGGKALTMPQYEKPELNALYLAKLGLINAAVQAYGDILWLDAGYLFSQKYRHDVPEGWKGYDRAGLDAFLGGTMADYARRGRPYLSGFTRKPRWYKPTREFLHGATWLQMSRLVRHFHAKRDRTYVNASLLLIPAAYWKERYPLLVEIWRYMEDQGIPGTEENILSILRWTDGLDTFSVEDGPDYMLGLRFPPPLV